METNYLDFMNHIGENNLDDQKTPIKLGTSKFKNILGITCYMNSILHILQQTPIFMEYITQAKFRDVIIQKLNSTEPDTTKHVDMIKEYVIFELFRLFKTSLDNDDLVITPTKFKQLIGKKNDMWNEYNHQDSQEFFNFLITQIEEEVGTKYKFIPGLSISDFDKTYTFDESIHNIIAINSWTSFQSREYSPLKNLFDGLIETKRRCMCCSSQVIRFEPFVTLPLSVPIKNGNMYKQFDIYNCLDYLTTEEQLDVDNKMNCDMCGLKNRGHSKNLLWKTPKILVLHIKRFLFNSSGIPTQKITNPIIYPIVNFNLAKYFNPASPYINSSSYDLIGINLHQTLSNSINSGHYTSIVKNTMDNKWYLYNDGKPVEQAQCDKDLQCSNAYMLFYCRHD